MAHDLKTKEEAGVKVGERREARKVKRLTYCPHWNLNPKSFDFECSEIKNWMLKNKLMLNEQKAEIPLCGPPTRRESVPVDSLSIDEAFILFSNVAETLGVTFDSGLYFHQHVSSVVRSCFFHVQSLNKVSSHLTCKAANSIAVSLILPRLDYSNSLLC